MMPQAWFGPAGREPNPPLDEAPGLPRPRTALPVVEGVPRHLEAHLARLEAGARHLGQRVDWLPTAGTALCRWLQTCVQPRHAALRLRLQAEAPCLQAVLEPLPVATQPYPLVVLPHPLASRKGDPALEHKGLAGPWSQGILAAARSQGAEDALLCWPDGTLAETAIASLAVPDGDRLLLPPTEGRVASLAERLDLPGWAAARGLRLTFAPVPLERARQAPLWCLNALRGIWRAHLL